MRQMAFRPEQILKRIHIGFAQQAQHAAQIVVFSDGGQTVVGGLRLYAGQTQGKRIDGCIEQKCGQQDEKRFQTQKDDVAQGLLFKRHPNQNKQKQDDGGFKITLIQPKPCKQDQHPA